jgi:hypothetical protein
VPGKYSKPDLVFENGDRLTPIFIAFANEQLAKLFYFIEQLAAVAVIAIDVAAAWKLFARWGIPQLKP